MSFNIYDTNVERVQYVGWLLACDASANIAKGERLLQQLDGAERQQAEHHANHLRQLYAGELPDNITAEDDDYEASIRRSGRR